MLARFKRDPGRVDLGDVVGDHFGLVRLDRFEQVGVGDQAQPLFPWVIGRGECHRIVTVAQMLLGHPGQRIPDLFRLVARGFEYIILHPNVLEAGDGVSQTIGQITPQGIGEAVLRGASSIPGRGALQHRDKRRAAGGQRRDDRRCGRSRADYHHLLVREIKVLRPELGVDNGARKALAARNLRIVGRIVVVVSGPQKQELAGHLAGSPRIVFERQCPARDCAVPVGGKHLAAKPDIAADVAVIDDLVEIFQNRRTIGNRLFMGPRLELEAQRVHVRIRTDAGIAEQIPGSAQVGTPLDDRIAFAAAFLAQMHRHADTRDARADDQHIDVGHGKFRLGADCIHRLLSRY